MSIKKIKDLIDKGKNITTKEYQDLLNCIPFGQSEYSDENFLLKGEFTPHRKLRQILLQYDKICYTLLRNKNGMEKQEIKRKEILNKIDEISDALSRNKTLPKLSEQPKEMTIYDRKRYELLIEKHKNKLEEHDINMSQSKKLVEDALKKKKNYEKILSELIPQVEILENKGIDFEKAEKEYWKRRFNTEAKLDVFLRKNAIPIDKETFKSILKLDTDTRSDILEDLGLDPGTLNKLELDFNNIDSKILLEYKDSDNIRR